MGRNALLDILQGASNAAADSVAVPVDLIAAGLRRVGVPVPQNALGGTQWQEEKGLRRKPQNALLGMAGETAGMVSPVVAFAKAPQIAVGMLQAGRNLASPSTINRGGAAGQRGVLAWHGTPADDFQEFSLDNFGRTDGGWLGKGVYAAESPVDASAYASKAGQPAGAVYRVDLDIQKPLVIDWDAPNRSELLGLRRQMGSEGFSQWLAQNGYDGVQFLGPKTATNSAGHRDIQWMALDPSKVKQVPVSAR